MIKLLYKPPSMLVSMLGAPERASVAELHATGDEHRRIRQAALDENRTQSTVQDF